MDEKNIGLSIGEVAKATGISVYTLRQWERRYGAPLPLKLDSGHRRYPVEELTRLKIVQKAIQLGFRAKQIVAMTYDEVFALLQNHKEVSHDALAVEHWIKCVSKWDSEKLTEYFHNDWRTLGPIGFVTERVSPFLQRLGEAWIQKEISISQEHFFSELLQSYLTNRWRAENSEDCPDSFLLASLSGEEHDLGLHMCAVALAAAKKRIIFLGTSTPVEDVIASAKATEVKTVCLSFSSLYPAHQAIKEVSRIRAELPDHIDIVVGGVGAPRGMDNIYQFSNIRYFYDWLQYEWKPQKEEK